MAHDFSTFCPITFCSPSVVMLVYNMFTLYHLSASQKHVHLMVPIVAHPWHTKIKKSHQATFAVQSSDRSIRPKVKTIPWWNKSWCKIWICKIWICKISEIFSIVGNFLAVLCESNIPFFTHYSLSVSPSKVLILRYEVISTFTIRFFSRLYCSKIQNIPIHGSWRKVLNFIRQHFSVNSLKKLDIWL